MHALLGLVAFGLLATSAAADPISLSYTVGAKSFKSVTSTDMLDFALYDDAACTNLLLGCREVGTTTLDVAAFAGRDDVVPATGDLTDTTDNANGSEWYYDGIGAEGWGFARGGSVVHNNACDVEGADPERRLCIHVTDGAVGEGHRCGAATFLDTGTWEWLLYHKD